MAHHKRKRARTAACGHYSNNALWRRLGDKSEERGDRALTKAEIYRRYSRMGYPRWWDKVFHTRPRRAATRSAERAALLTDAEGLIWPLDKKPHKYYW